MVPKRSQLELHETLLKIQIPDSTSILRNTIFKNISEKFASLMRNPGGCFSNPKFENHCCGLYFQGGRSCFIGKGTQNLSFTGETEVNLYPKSLKGVFCFSKMENKDSHVR